MSYNATIRNRETLVQCPYEKAHMIRQGRMARHLVLCAKNHEDRGFVVCLYNAQHHLPPEQYENHLMSCSHRSMVERELRAAESRSIRPVSPDLPDCSEDSSAKPNLPVQFEDEEEWGVSSATNTTKFSYDMVDMPKKDEACYMNVTKLSSLTKSKKKKIHQDRLEKYKREAAADRGSGSSEEGSSSVTGQSSAPEKLIRLPTNLPETLTIVSPHAGRGISLSSQTLSVGRTNSFSPLSYEAGSVSSSRSSSSFGFGRGRSTSSSCETDEGGSWGRGFRSAATERSPGHLQNGHAGQSVADALVPDASSKRDGILSRIDLYKETTERAAQLMEMEDAGYLLTDAQRRLVSDKPKLDAVLEKLQNILKVNIK